MNRSKWKGSYINIKSLKQKQKLLIGSRSSQIIQKFLGLSFNVYNGKKYIELIVSENMIGHKFGEFSFTRAKFTFKKKTKKK